MVLVVVVVVVVRLAATVLAFLAGWAVVISSALILALLADVVATLLAGGALVVAAALVLVFALAADVIPALLSGTAVVIAAALNGLALRVDTLHVARAVDARSTGEQPTEAIKAAFCVWAVGVPRAGLPAAKVISAFMATPAVVVRPAALQIRLSDLLPSSAAASRQGDRRDEVQDDYR